MNDEMDRGRASVRGSRAPVHPRRRSVKGRSLGLGLGRRLGVSRRFALGRRGMIAMLLACMLALVAGAGAFAAGGASPTGADGAGGAAGMDVGARSVGLGAESPLAAAARAVGSDAEAPPAESEGGSVVGILLDNTPPQLGPDDPDVGDSYLGILLSPNAGELLSVTYLLAEGVEYTRDSVAPGWQAARPRDPVWPASRPWPVGFRGEPVFNGWCTDEAGTTPYDFSQPVVADLVLWAAWADGGRDAVKVTLDAGEGGLVADPTQPAATPGRTLELWLRPGSAYPALPTPAKTGWEFVGWYDAETGGSQVYPTPEGTPAGAEPQVPEGGCTLWARWAPKTYWVHYVIDSGAGSTYDQRVPYDQNAGATFMRWDGDGGLAELGYQAPQGKKLLGWHTDPAGNDDAGTFYGAGNALPDLAAAAPGGSLNVYAQWQGEYGPDEFSVAFKPEGGAFADGSGTDKRYENVALGTVLDAFEDPKRAGYQFGGWWLRANDAPDGALVRQWGFSEAVHEDLVLYARWDLRLDVTVPVSVAFAVDAESGEAIGPDAERYALKSRTVVPVAVKELELRSEQAELEAFFEPADGEPWADGVRETKLSLESEHASRAVELALAGERKALGAESADYAIPAFAYGGLAADDAWEGADPCERLRIAFGLAISDKLKVRLGQPDAVPIAHLKVTVSA